MQSIVLEAAGGDGPEPSPHRIKPDPAASSSKRERPERACDFCRKRKTKCDGPWASDRICSNCRSSQIQCTYNEASKPRAPPKAYINSLEDRVEKTEELIRRLYPHVDVVGEIGPPIERGSWKPDFVPSRSNRPPDDKPGPKRSSQSPDSSSAISVAIRPGPPGSNRSSETPPYIGPQADSSSPQTQRSTEPGEEDDEYDDSIVEGDTGNRYIGKSSSRDLVQATAYMKREFGSEYIGRALPLDPDVPEYEYRNWQELRPLLSFNFPSSDLSDQLINLYFNHLNSIFPLLHRPTFEIQLKSYLHERDRAFAGLYLAMLACASRWSNDPRVFSTHQGKTERLSSGWVFYRESLKYRPTASAPAGLFDLQRLALLSQFLRWTSHAPAAWCMSALALRLAQDMGAYRKKRYSGRPTVENELWKRAWWILVVYDTVGSASLGRPCCVREEDFDVDMPLEVDDEYWIDDDPQLAFRQPPGKPSVVAAFNCFVKLSQMMAFTIRTIYCIDKTKVLLGLVGPTWREQVIQQLNDAMDEWTQDLPEHLRWGPQVESNPTFANQSATLYTTYYLLLLLIYRPFIPPVTVPRVDGKPVVTAEYPFPALAICVSAARAGVRILETQMARGLSNLPNMIAVAHLCGAVLLLHFWEVKKQSPSTDQTDIVKDVKTCLKALEFCSDRWELAGSFLKPLRQGLPNEPQRPIIKKESRDNLQVPPAPAPAPPRPPGSPDYPHERAMQPPILTEGWHWFSQVGIGSGYQPTPQPAIGISAIRQPVGHNTEHLPAINQAVTGLYGDSPYSAQPSWPSSNPVPAPVTHHHYPYHHSQGRYEADNLPPLVATREMPWWIERAIDRRPALPQGSGPTSMNVAGGRPEEWHQLAGSSIGSYAPISRQYEKLRSTSPTRPNFAMHPMFTSTQSSRPPHYYHQDPPRPSNQ